MTPGTARPMVDAPRVRHARLAGVGSGRLRTDGAPTRHGTRHDQHAATRQVVTGTPDTPDTEDRNRAPVAAPALPTLEPNEKLWLESYLDRLKNAPGVLLKRLVVYGSKARGDARPGSDVDVLVLVGDAPDAERNARELIYGGDDPDDIDHSVVVQTDADWLRDLEKELPFPRNVEAEGVQIHPVYQPASRPPGDRPPVTRKGIRHAVPVWLKEAQHNLKALAYEIEELKAGRFKIPVMAVRRAFDAVFFSAMAWCLTRGVSVVRRKDLPASVERHLIEPGVLDPGWQDRIRTLWAAWTAEFDWRPGVDAPPTVDDAVKCAETAREFCALARDAIETDGIELDDPDEAGTSGNSAETEAAR